MKRNLPLFLTLVMLGCQPDLERQPKVPTLGSSPQFADGAAARPLMNGVRVYDEKDGVGEVSSKSPKWDLGLLRRGRQRYDIYCAVCHGLSGHGDGMVTQRGYPHLKDFADMQMARDEDIFRIVTEGTSADGMPPFGADIRPSDRWALVGYVRVLAFRNHVPEAWLSREDRAALGSPP